VLKQAAQTAKRSREFSAIYAAIAKRRGKKIATIAISRKLLTRAWHLLAAAQAADPAADPAADDNAATAAHPETGKFTKPRGTLALAARAGHRPRVRPVAGFGLNGPDSLGGTDRTPMGNRLVLFTGWLGGRGRGCRRWCRRTCPG
jgi:hypothetical protein